MNVGYAVETYTDDFSIDFAKKEKCKGILKLEVSVVNPSVPLLVKDGSGVCIVANDKPFVITSNYPITKGIIQFEFSEYSRLTEINEKEKKKAIVRYLYCEK
ncbi:hypothetical protein [uncultured Tenacibaculum sp.]|uniref:hypothetical protein n=1 Tax=uncultured Tenacibaculum sp. TaxID=174713 RepID=UPI00262E867F|nr:hypothetical protein [uncultured Tenacibaculum sp.]